MISSSRRAMKFFYICPLLQKLTRQTISIFLYTIKRKSVFPYKIQLLVILNIYCVFAWIIFICNLQEHLMCTMQALFFFVGTVKDSVVVRCAEVIESLFQMANAPPINELIDLKGKGHNQKNGGKDKPNFFFFR